MGHIFIFSFKLFDHIESKRCNTGKSCDGQMAEWLWRVTQVASGLFVDLINEYSRRATCRGSNPLLFSRNIVFALCPWLFGAELSR